MPARKKSGDLLVSGTRNMTSPLTAIVSKDQSESSLARLIESISTATESNATNNPAVDTLTAHFVRTILVLACFGFCWTYVASDVSTGTLNRINLACERAMAVLAAACPCALGLATPSAIMAGLGM